MLLLHMVNETMSLYLHLHREVKTNFFPLVGS